MGISKSYQSFPHDQLQLDNCTQFCLEVEHIVTSKRMSYIEAVLTLAEKKNIEPKLAAAYLNPDIKDRIRIEAENLNYMPKTASLY